MQVPLKIDMMALGSTEVDQALHDYLLLKRLRPLRWSGCLVLPMVAMFGGEKFQWMWWVSLLAVVGNPIADVASAKCLAEASLRLMRHASPEIVPSILDVQRRGSRKARNIAERCLIRSLPKLNEAHSNLLHRANLNALNSLVFHQNKRLALAVIRCLRFVGNRSSVDTLSRFAEMRTSSNKSPGPELVEARETLAVLNVQLEVARLKGLLVRPSVSPHTEVLVRPTSAAETDIQLLVRPSQDAN